MNTTENSVSDAKLGGDPSRADKFAEYVENNPIEIYVDYRDELSDEQVDKILEGKADDVRWEIEDNYYNYSDNEDYYWDNMAEELGVERSEIDEWRDEDGFWPGVILGDYEWKQLLRNTNVYVTAIMWDVNWCFNNWAYAAPIEYSDVKDALKILNINPYEFREKRRGGSMTAGEGTFKGYFPNMPNRDPAVSIEDLYDNMCTLYDGVMTFLLGDLENIIEVLKDDPKDITFKKGTNVVMYDYGGGAGITEVELQEDVTVKRKDVEFRNDKNMRYGIQSCYGFVDSYWKQGGISAKSN